MGVFKELDPDIAWKAIEGYTDVLGPEAKGLDAFYRQFRCPRCKGELQKEFSSKHAFSDPGTAIARALLRCPTCRFLLEPHTNLVIESGSPAKIPIEAIPHLNVDD